MSIGGPDLNRLSPAVHFARDEVELLYDLLADAMKDLPDPKRWTLLNSLRTMFAELGNDMDDDDHRTDG